MIIFRNVNKFVISPKNGNGDRDQTPKHKFNLKAINESLKAKEDSEFFNYSDEKDLDLTTEEKAQYGSREPKDYKKIKCIGK